MMEGIAEYIRLNATLERYDDKMLNALYTDVFSSEKGQLVLQDLANRTFVAAPTSSQLDEGMRAVYLSITTRLKNAILARKDV